MNVNYFLLVNIERAPNLHSNIHLFELDIASLSYHFLDKQTIQRDFNSILVDSVERNKFIVHSNTSLVFDFLARCETKKPMELLNQSFRNATFKKWTFFKNLQPFPKTDLEVLY